MFVQQAARQFEIWTGKPAPVGDMLRAVTVALQERARRSRRKIEGLTSASRIEPKDFSFQLYVQCFT